MYVCLLCVCVCSGYVYGLMGARGDVNRTSRKVMVDDSMVLVKEQVSYLYSQRVNESRIECRGQSESFFSFFFGVVVSMITMG